jgi:hypothetical protein
MDVELPGFTCFRQGVIEALERGILDMATVDAAVTRVLVEKSRLGLFEKPYVDAEAIDLSSAEHRSTAARAAARSLVLLKNDGILPLRDEGTTALIGPLADDQLALFCGYSFPVHLFAARLEDPGFQYAKTCARPLPSGWPSSSLQRISIRPSERCPVFRAKRCQRAGDELHQLHGGIGRPLQWRGELTGSSQRSGTCLGFSSRALSGKDRMPPP